MRDREEVPCENTNAKARVEEKMRNGVVRMSKSQKDGGPWVGALLHFRISSRK